MDYIKTSLNEEIVIKNIYTIHYFEYAKDYVFKGEKHNFWEIVYVDKGEMIFHKPNEFHNLWANGKIAPNLVIVSFECKSKTMKYFEGKIIQGEDFEKDILAKIISEARNAYSSPLDDTYLMQLQKRENPLFGSEQLIKNNLELLLITLFRKGKSVNKSTKFSAVTKQRYDNEKIKKIIGFLKDNIYNDISFEDVCRFSNQSKTNLKLLFKSAKGIGVMEYYNMLKIEEIKRLIREEPMSFTDIASKLAYTSIHYFSSHFKKATGMTPTQYATSVKAKEMDL